MLGKLIRYDLKASMKIFFMFHLVFLLACGLGRVFFMNQLDFINAPGESLFVPIVILTCLITILIVTVYICSWLMITFRFYRNLFSAEGYLSWTLPVSGIRQLWAKIISGCILMWIDTIVIALGMLLLFTGRNVTEAYSLIAADATEALGMTISAFFLYTFLFWLISCITSVISTYFCIAMGQLFPSHRVLCAVATYFILSFVLQIGMFLMMLLSDSFDFYIGFTGTFAEQMEHVMVPTFLFSAVVTIGQYIVTHYIIKKKINLI